LVDYLNKLINVQQEESTKQHLNMGIKVSAMVVGRNEANKLDACLKSLSFCDEILYGDLNSSDNSISIASKHNCKIFEFKTFGPAGEYTHSELIKYISNDWVIFIDPDEVIDNALAIELQCLLPVIDNDQKIGSVSVPWQFYFGKLRLKGTVWGYNKFKEVIANKKKFDFFPITHYGRRLKPGFQTYTVINTSNNVLHHYWMDDIKSFIKKHKKYLKDEGKDKYNLGQRTSIIRILLSFFYQFFFCFIMKKGYRDGFVGFFLSVFWTWYTTSSYISLYQTTLKAK
jgi:hypothetical protein